MKTTKLEDFTEDQLRLMLRLANRERIAIEQEVAGLRRIESVASALDENIQEDISLLKDLDTITTQFAGALFQVESERKITWN